LLAGKTIFIHWEQGFGDTLQFCRYASLAADMGACVILSVQDELLRLFDDFDSRIEVIGADRTPASFDYSSALLSLPLAFRTTVESIPSASAYLRANPDKLAAWSSRLGGRGKPRIGLAWSGSVNHRNDRNRSIPMNMMSALLSVDAEWICLQKEIRESDRQALAERPDLKVFGPDLVDFSETAALIGNLDLVITIDTSVAHLAAAMGKPTWILLPVAPDWRWLLGRDDSPWHPTARLFRQSASGSWEAVIERVQMELEAHLAKARL
jgi:hypothetical protein